MEINNNTDKILGCMVVPDIRYCSSGGVQWKTVKSTTGYYEGRESDHLSSLLLDLKDEQSGIYDWKQDRRHITIFTGEGEYEAIQGALLLTNDRSIKLRDRKPEDIPGDNEEDVLQVISYREWEKNVYGKNPEELGKILGCNVLMIMDKRVVSISGFIKSLGIIWDSAANISFYIDEMIHGEELKNRLFLELGNGKCEREYCLKAPGLKDIVKDVKECAGYFGTKPAFDEEIGSLEIKEELSKIRDGIFREDDIFTAIFRFTKTYENKEYRGDTELSMDEFFVGFPNHSYDTEYDICDSKYMKTEGCHTYFTRTENSYGYRRYAGMTEVGDRLKMNVERLKNYDWKYLYAKLTDSYREQDSHIYHNYIFKGNHGSGRKTALNYLRDRFIKYDICNRRIIILPAAELVMRYSESGLDGFRNIFEEVKGGMIMIEDAGMLISPGSVGNKKRAASIMGKMIIHEIVGYMEMNPDTTFIFSMLSGESGHFLNSDPAMRRLICDTVEFRDQTEEDLFRIFLEIMDSEYKTRFYEGKELAEIHDLITDYVKKMRMLSGDEYENAWIIRKLFDEIELEEACSKGKALPGEEKKQKISSIRNAVHRAFPENASRTGWDELDDIIW